MSQSLPTGHTPTREEVARIEVGHTTVSRPVAISLVLGFLFCIVVPVLIESAVRTAAGVEASTAWPQLSVVPAEMRRAMRDGSQPLWSRVVAANRVVLAALTGFEDALEDEAVPARQLRPPAQYALTTWLGVGNERVYKGLDGWLYYRPDVEYVTGPGFLEPARLARRVASAREWTDVPHPDPREAIVDFHRQLQARGIRLVVLPTPVKPSVHPERLARGVPGPMENASYGRFVRDLEREGVTVFDVWQAIGVPLRAHDDAPLYLATDTHWQPRTMERVASALAEAIRAQVDLPAVALPEHTWQRHVVSQRGDTAAMLDLPEGQTLYVPETVELRRVLERDGSPWRPDRAADVLVLGDSFSNIYSLSGLGWGDAAGLIEHLSLALGRPIDRIVQNDEGAHATRERLRQEMAAGSDRLEGKRVVVYQFATRELAAGDWKMITLPRGR